MRFQLLLPVPGRRQQLVFAADGFAGEPHDLRRQYVGDDRQPNESLLRLTRLQLQRFVDRGGQLLVELAVDGGAEHGVGYALRERRFVQAEVLGDAVGVATPLMELVQEAEEDLRAPCRTAVLLQPASLDALDVLAFLHGAREPFLVAGGEQVDLADLPQVHSNGVVDALLLFDKDVLALFDLDLLLGLRPQLRSRCPHARLRGADSLSVSITDRPLSERRLYTLSRGSKSSSSWTPRSSRPFGFFSSSSAKVSSSASSRSSNSLVIVGYCCSSGGFFPAVGGLALLMKFQTCLHVPHDDFCVGGLIFGQVLGWSFARHQLSGVLNQASSA